MKSKLNVLGVVFISFFIFVSVSVNGLENEIVLNEKFEFELPSQEIYKLPNITTDTSNLPKFIGTYENYDLYIGTIVNSVANYPEFGNISITNKWDSNKQLTHYGNFDSEFAQTFLVYDFDDTMTFKNSSIISYYTKNTNNSKNTVGFIFKKDGNVNCELIIINHDWDRLGRTGTELCGISVIDNETLYQQVGQVSAQTITLKNITYINETVEFDKLYIRFMNTYETSESPFYNTWDNLTISFYNGTNELPSFNLSIDGSPNVCIPEDQDSYTFNLTLETNDPEDDTLYYADSFGSIKNVTENVRFTEYKTISGLSCNPEGALCFPYSDYSFLDNSFYPYEETSRISDQDVYNSSKFNLVTKTNWNDIPEIMLFLDTRADGTDNAFYYRFDNRYGDFSYSQRFYDIEDNETFNISFHDDRLDNLLKLEFIDDDNTNQMDIYYLNTSNEQQLLTNFSLDTLRNAVNGKAMGVVITRTRNDNEWQLFIEKNKSTDFYEINNADTNQNRMSVLRLSVSNQTTETVPNIETTKSDVMAGSFEILGVSASLDYSTTPIDSFTVDTSDFDNSFQSFYTIYVTDDVHLNQDTLSDSVYYSLSKSDICIGGSGFKGTETGDTRYTPDFNNEFVNGLLFFFRFPRRLLEDLNLFGMWNLVTVMGLLLVFGRKYQRMTEDPQSDQEQILMKVTESFFISVFMLYFVFLLLGDTIFTVISLFGLLYLGGKIRNMTAGDTDDFNKNLVYGTAYFSLLNYFYFSFVEIGTGISFNVPSLSIPSLTLVNAPTIIGNFVSFLWKIIFFSIPSVPTFVNGIFITIRVFSIFTLLVVLYNAISPTAEG